MSEPRSDRALPYCLGLGAVALAYRAFLTRIDWGHEEEDWSNLQMIRGIHDGWLDLIRDRDFETEHMPLFTWLAALFTGIVGDPQLGAEVLAALCGAGTVAITTWIGIRWFSPVVGLAAGLLLCFQPESALYSASPLRESLYTLGMMGGIALIGRRRVVLGGVVFAITFLARFNIAFSILPALGLWLLWPRRDTPRAKEHFIALGLVVVTILAWATYYHHQVGTWAFWSGVMDSNTGNAVTDLFLEERVRAVVGAALGLSLVVIPQHVGWVIVPLVILALFKGRNTVLRNEEAATWVALCALWTFALLLATALFSTYEWKHNLYWKWLTPSVPFLCLLGAQGGRVAVEAFARHPLVARGSFLSAFSPAAVQGGLAVLILVITGQGYFVETNRQITDSNRNYGTQVRVAQWFEEAWDEEAGVLTWDYSIPAA